MSTTSWTRAPDVLVRRTGDRVMLLPVNSDEPIRLAGTAALVWELLEDGREEGEVAEAVAQRFREHPGDIGDDVRAFLLELHEHGLVRGSR